MPYISLRNCKIVCDGNSITYGAIYAAAQFNTDYPYQLGYQLNQQGLNVTVANVGVNGQSTITLTNGAVSAMVTDAVSQVDALFDPNVLNICIAWEGGNEIYYTEPDVNRVQNAYKAMRDYCLLRQSKGFYVVVMDNLPRANGFYPGSANIASYAADLLAYNELIRQNWRDFANSYIDTRKYLPQLIPNGFYMTDGVHPTPDANVLIANCVISHLRCIPIRNYNKAIDFMAITQRFLTAGPFSTTVPSNVSRLRIICRGADAGGGSGRKSATGIAASGGAGGSAGAKNDIDLPLSVLGLVAGDIVSGVVGAAGIGGAAQTVNSTNGNNGTNGGNSWAIKGASGTNYIVYANGGTLGAGGLTTVSGGGAIATGMFPSIAGGSTSITANSAAVSSTFKTNGSGAAGGCISAGNAAFAGGIGGRGNAEVDPLRVLTGTGGANTGVAGGNGGFPLANTSYVDGGGGGGASLTGNGGAGGVPSGGGGASRDSVGNSGPGANGLPGQVIFIWY
jgi:lysophospholipase L1-like esterase